MTTLNYVIRNLLITCSIFVLVGCATPARVEKMTVSEQVISSARNETFERAIFITGVSGGKDTNPLLYANVGNEGFRTALAQSLRNHDLLSASLDDSKYLLRANLLGLNRGAAVGLSFTATSHVYYELLTKDSKELYLGETVKADFTATMLDSLVGVKRGKIAMEKAVQENIREFLSRLLVRRP